MKVLRNLGERLARVNPLVNFSVARYVLSIGIFVGVVIFGFIATRTLGVDLLPSTNIPVVSVSTSYPGATPELVDKEVSQVVEGAVAGIAGVTGIDSNSNSGSSRVTVSFNEGTDQDAAANQVASAVSGLRGLPDGAGQPSVRTFDPNAQPILEFGVAGGAARIEDVYDYVEDILLPQLQRVDGVANVEVGGGARRQYEVLLSPERLAAAGLSPQQVTNAITGATVNAPIGSITREGTTLNFSTRSVPANLAEIGEVVVDTAKNLRVADLGTLRDASAVTSYTRVDGVPVVLVSVQQAAGSNAVAVADGVRRLLAGIPLPAGYEVRIGNDTTGPIRAAINSTTRELFVTAVVVAVIVLLFLGRVNTAFTVILAIPISLAASPILYTLMGFTFNQVSLLAMIVAIGIVVDDSIVVAENVERYREEGLTRLQSVLRGASEVFGAVAAASLSLLAVLVPVSFIGGFIGAYLQQFALGLAAAVLLSWLEALLFLTVRMAYTPDARPQTWREFPRALARLPEAFRSSFRFARTFTGVLLWLATAALLWRFLGPAWAALALLFPVALGVLNYLWGVGFGFLEALTLTLNGLTERLLSAVRNAYTASLPGVLAASPAVLLLAVGVLFLTFTFIAPKIPFQFTPQSDNGTFNAGLRLPNGTSLAASNELIARLENFLLSQREVRTVQINISGSGARANVTLVPLDERPGIFELISRYQGQVQGLFADQPDVRVFINAGGGFRGQGSALNLNLVSPNSTLLAERADEAVKLIETNPFVLSVNSGSGNTNLQNNFVPDPARLAGTGVGGAQVAQVLQGYAGGSSAGSIDVNGLSYPVEVKIDPTRLQDVDALLSLPIYSPTLQTNLAVGQLGRIVQAQAPSSVSRTNRLYTQGLSVQLAEGAPAQLVFQQQLEDQLTRAGVLDNQVSLTAGGGRFGQNALSQQLGTVGLQVFALGLLLVYLVMGAQFNSFRYPIYLLLPVPFAVAGAMWFIFMSGQSLDIFSVMGFLLLIGLSAKNAILYLEFVVDRLERMPLKDALIESAALRFRPIVMTTLTILVISFPLIFGHGEGSEFNRGIGITMLGGILVSALMTFFVVPAAFYLFERGRQTKAEPQPGPAPRKGAEGRVLGAD